MRTTTSMSSRTRLEVIPDERSTPVSLRTRLDAIQESLKKITQEAIQRKGYATTPRSRGPLPAWSSSSHNNSIMGDPNASFHLGMELFGQEVADAERILDEKLTAMESEIQKLNEMVKNDENTFWTYDHHDGGEDDHDDENQEEETEGDSPRASQPSWRTREEWEREAQQLMVRIQFLRACSAARAALDQSETWSTPALTTNELDYVQAAKLWVQAQAALDRARFIVQQATQKLGAAAIPGISSESRSSSSTTALATAHQMINGIQTWIRRQKVVLLTRAKSLWNTSVALSRESITVHSAAQLAEAYDLLEILSGESATKHPSPQPHPDQAGHGDPLHNILHDLLRTWSKKLCEEVLMPVIRQHQPGQPPPTQWSFQETEEPTHSSSSSSASSALVLTTKKKKALRLEWSHQVVSTDQKCDLMLHLKLWEETFTFLQRLLAFVADKILLNRPSLCAAVGRHLFGQFSHTDPSVPSLLIHIEALGLDSNLGNVRGMLAGELMELLEDSCIPSFLSTNDLGQLGLGADQLRQFMTPVVNGWTSRGFLTKAAEERLTSFVQHFESRYTEKRRCTILNEARHVLLHNDYHNTVQVGVEVPREKADDPMGDGFSIFLLHKSSISETASKVMDICRRTMEEAVDSSQVPANGPLGTLSSTLYRTAREVLDLFRAIIPVSYGHEVASVPRTAAVLHNDCVFFAHHCLTLGLEFKEKFPSAEADDERGTLLRQTCTFLDFVPLFRDLADRSMGDMLDLQAKQLVELVGERISFLGEALSSDEVLAEWADAETAMSAGTYHLRQLHKAWTPVLSYDVANRCLCYLTDVVISLFMDQVMKANDISANACQFASTLFQRGVNDLGSLLDGDTKEARQWERFVATSRFMDMSLSDVQIALSDGIFRSVTGAELSKLITACFGDSEKRRNLLKLLSKQ